MLLTHITLKNFRNIAEKSILLHPKLTLIIGDNARGKTNVLESICTLLNGQGFREGKEMELVSFDQEETSIVGDLEEDGNVQTFFIRITKIGEESKKHYGVDKVPKTAYLYRQFLPKSVLFSPEDIKIIAEGAEERRDYIDFCLELFSQEYKQKRKNYMQALRKRNKILESCRSLEQAKDETAFWDNYLEEHANYVTKKRKAYVHFLNIEPRIDGKVFNAVYVPNIFTKEKVVENLAQDYMTKRTSIGPQKDDIRVLLNDIDTHTYGSRSQQRLAVLWLKLRELSHAKEENGKNPILLLDDITSEFDEKNKEIISHILSNYQTVITTTESSFAHKFGNDCSIIEL
jgi:DNA replication and repair protein RecF